MKFFNGYKTGRERMPDSEAQEIYSEDMIRNEFDKAKGALDMDMEEYQTKMAAQRHI